MAATKNYSLSALKIGAIEADGSFSKALSAFVDPVRNTCVFAKADGTDTTFNTEIADDPWLKVTEPGETTIKFDFYVDKGADLVKVMGGTFDATSNTWTAPISAPSIEYSVELTHTNGAKVQLVRVSIQAVPEWNFMRNNLPVIHVTGTVLSPADGTGAYKYIAAS